MIINKKDNVEVNIQNGHKYALCDISSGENIIKYGSPIGHAVCDIKRGEHVHTHNMKTNLSDKIDYKYEYNKAMTKRRSGEKYFMGYLRENGDVGIRNEIWIINTVGCVNKIAKKLADLTGAYSFEHPCGCSQLGDDHKITQLILKGLVNHPNVGGVLVLGLGCENNNIEEFKKVLGEYNSERVKFLNSQDVSDEISEGVRLIEELKTYVSKIEKKLVPVSKLRIGLKCGGSDGLSGITANPLIGNLADEMIEYGAGCVLTEVPEMFGAEQILMNRCTDRGLFEETVNMINNFKDYFAAHNQVIYENPSPGNKEGGITTLEEKSLGCIQKGGSSQITAVLDYGDRAPTGGLSLLNGPGNDMVAITNLTACGCQLILFSTGRGTPLGAPVPTIKIATNHTIAQKKSAWIDFDGAKVLDGMPIEQVRDELFDFVIETASGRETASERNGCREIAIFKDGVIM